MNRSVVFTAAAALTLAFAMPAATKSAAVPTANPGALVVALGPPSAGFVAGTIRGNSYIHPQGYEVDIARRIAANLHLAPKFVYAPRSVVLNSGQKGVDVAFARLLIRATAAPSVVYTHSYFDANEGVLLSKGAKAPRTIVALRHMRTCAQADSNGLVWIQQLVHPTKSPLVLRSAALAFRALRLGHCAALVMDAPVLAIERSAHPRAYGPLAAQILTHAQYGGVVAKNSKLLPFLNTQIDALWTSGVIGKLQKKWFGFDFAHVPGLK